MVWYGFKESVIYFLMKILTILVISLNNAFLHFKIAISKSDPLIMSVSSYDFYVSHSCVYQDVVTQDNQEYRYLFKIILMHLVDVLQFNYIQFIAYYLLYCRISIILFILGNKKLVALTVYQIQK